MFSSVGLSADCRDVALLLINLLVAASNQFSSSSRRAMYVVVVKLHFGSEIVIYKPPSDCDGLLEDWLAS